jgi:hypothetical protein
VARISRSTERRTALEAGLPNRGPVSRFPGAPHGLPLEIDEDAHLRGSLAALGPAALRELRDVLRWPPPRRDALLRLLVGRPRVEPIAQLIAIADTDEVARLRLLRAIRDLLTVAI